MPEAYERLTTFLDGEMQMSHIYQPAMLEVLLTHSGRATIRDELALRQARYDSPQRNRYPFGATPVRQVNVGKPVWIVAKHGVQPAISRERSHSNLDGSLLAL